MTLDKLGLYVFSEPIYPTMFGNNFQTDGVQFTGNLFASQKLESR